MSSKNKPNKFSHNIGSRPIKDSGQRQAFETGAVRDIQEGKGRFDLMPHLALIELAKHFEGGAKKYGENNWKKGIPTKRFMDSALRHLSKAAAGMDDEDHLIAAAWNVLCLVETKILISKGELPETLLE